MKLRFEVNRVNLFRGEIGEPRSVVIVEIDSTSLSREERDLLADRLVGIDVTQLRNGNKGTEQAFTAVTASDLSVGKAPKPIHIRAQAPTFEALMLAVREHERQVLVHQAQRRALALATADAGIDTVAALEELASQKAATTETEIFAFMQKHGLDPNTLGSRQPKP